MIRAVLDTNLLVSALLFGGVPYRVYQLGVQKKIVMIASAALIGELEEVLGRPKFVEQFIRNGQTPKRLVVDYVDSIEFVKTAADVPPDAVRDPKDRMVLAVAVGGKADYIISGDSDLIALNHYQNIPILSATDFLEKAQL